MEAPPDSLAGNASMSTLRQTAAANGTKLPLSRLDEAAQRGNESGSIVGCDKIPQVDDPTLVENVDIRFRPLVGCVPKGE